ncbi:hypothetical protein OBBRIDRAFT_718237 [Obba rivulosa]|uniref:Nucleoporin Pom152 n=1 Tax=Obba rivulosa TaxID=1052685 RepID=A0A8E2DVI3_9APHY|nr:hypothetical protein OBBRIDRAFT_718237 [Obba rivulosa]
MADSKAQAAGSPPSSGTLIPESFLDVPSQRLYVFSLWALCQAIKIFDWFQYLVLPSDSRGSYGRKWFIFDFLFCTCLAKLHIPRLRYTKSVVVLQILSLWLLDGFMFGVVTVNVGGEHSWLPSLGFSSMSLHWLTSTPQTSTFWDLVPRLGLGSLVGTPDGGKDAHLLGQHTVRMSPIGTAQLNPYGHTFCLAAPGQSVLVPILLNNTSPVTIRYALTPLGYGEENKEQRQALGKIEHIDLSLKELRAIENSRLEGLQVARTSASRRDGDEYDEYDDDDEDDAHSRDSPSLQKTQDLVHLRVTKPGTIRLEYVRDQHNVDARIVYPGEVTVVPCPSVHFTTEAGHEEDVRCAVPGLSSGAGEELQFDIDIYGVPPLSLRWHREIDGKREAFMVEGIESSEHIHHHHRSMDDSNAGARGHRAPVELKVPLTATLDTLGKHSYILESVTDALGNVVPAGKGPAAHTHGTEGQTHRSVTVLKRPAVAFKNCGPGSPAPLLIGSQASLKISAHDADALDAPWDITLKYQPPAAEESGKSKRRKPWLKEYKTEKAMKDLVVQADAPGEYVIAGVKGKYCEGDVLSPETCKVVERPLPSAEIEWKKIHECSGDIGVSASLVLHGTPPFTVYYRMQRDKAPAKDLFKTFGGSRGEITIQPDHSGHYRFEFTHLSDVNYKRVELKGPSIDQIVHPPASADFVHNLRGTTGKKRINTCSGSLVDVDVELKGTGPWNLELQAVGPKKADTIKVTGITTDKKTVHVPIPKDVDVEGGTFEIDLVSVEDAYGCKRGLSVPGVSVNVRRVQPTARFYGATEKRNVTILDYEQASLPLRLTGDGPWRLKYRRVEVPERVHSATLQSPNAELRVTDQGLYEIIEVSDSQCPGTVVKEDATYRVNHVLRPSAKLSSEVQFTYEPYNGSHILPPICEGLHDHVDLDLKGRAPFQIMYNVARDAENGGTKILDQPVFNSIQPRTRFQLHTSEAARIYYEVKQIGDAAYPLAKNKHAVIPRSERLLFEQQVLMRPSARFRNHNRLSYCLNDVLTPHDFSSPDGVIVLEGTPPFQLQLSIRNLAASEVHTETIQLQDNVWKLDLPSYTFRSIGPHLVTIDSVQDASHCEQAVPDPLHRSIWLDVAETAAIVPFDRRQDYCVGDVTQFQLEGTPPWTIGYRINGKSYTQEAKKSPFSILQQQPGEFTVTSIAHQQKMCKTAVTDLRYNVHPLPAARVGHGQRIVQDIHEGDQAEIVFTLIGEPPFTFTYQRTELTTKKGAQGKVLETHTVSGVTTNEYSIFSALEGTWTITFIADRYCRYPPAPPDGLAEKSRR